MRLSSSLLPNLIINNFLKEDAAFQTGEPVPLQSPKTNIPFLGIRFVSLLANSVAFLQRNIWFITTPVLFVNGYSDHPSSYYQLQKLLRFVRKDNFKFKQFNSHRNVHSNPRVAKRLVESVMQWITATSPSRPLFDGWQPRPLSRRK